MSYADQVKAVLQEEFVRAKARNPAFSMRAFAARLGVAQSVISQVMSDKRPLTKKTAHRILLGLGRNPAEASRILEGAPPDTPAFTALEIDSFSIVADWYHFAILSLAETDGFRGTPAWIAARLGITMATADEALTRLLRLGLLVRNGRKIAATGKRFEAISPQPHLALRKANQENLALAETALAKVPLEKRDFSAITLCFDPARMEEARRLIQTFRRNFDRIMESGKKREVYKLAVQLFPLSR